MNVTLQTVGRKALSMVLALALVLSMVPAFVVAADDGFSDTAGHWAEAAIGTWAGYGVLSGYPDGTFLPNGNISRAELAKVLNGIIGYQTQGSKSFSDVATGDWFAEAVLKLADAGVMQGSDGLARPNDAITREEAAVLIARAFTVDGNSSTSNAFADAGDIATWAYDLVNGMKTAGYVQGSENRFSPKSNITRGEVVTILNNMISVYYNEAGTYGGTTVQNITGNVVVSSADVVLQNMNITGNLYLMNGLAKGAATVKNVTVSEKTFVRGGGSNSVHLENCKINELVVDGDSVRVVLADGTTVTYSNVVDGTVVLGSGVVVNSIVIAAGGTVVVQSGVTLKAAEIAGGTLNVEKGGVVTKATATASGSKLANEGTVTLLEVEAAIAVTGSSAVTEAVIKANGSTFVKAPTRYSITVGYSAVMAGSTVTGSTGGGGGSSGGSGWGDDVTLASSKTAKLAKVPSLTGLTEADYTVASWNAVKAAIEADIAAINACTTIAEVNAYVITASLSTLVTLLDEAKTNKLATVPSLDDLVEGFYTAASWAEVKAAIEADIAAINACTTVAEVGAYVITADLADLVAMPMDVVRPLKLTLVPSLDDLDEADYTAASWAAVKAAIAADILAINGFANVQDVIDYVITADLDNLVTKLDDAKATKLALVPSLDGLVEAEYTATSWAAVKAAIEADIAAINACTTVQAVTDYVITAKLSDLVSALAEAKTNKLALVPSLDGLTEADYTAASWAAVKAAIEADIAAINACTTVTEVTDYVITADLDDLVTKLDDAKATKLALVPSLDDLVEGFYTAESWAAVKAAIEIDIAAINACTTVDAVTAYVITAKLSDLVTLSLTEVQAVKLALVPSLTGLTEAEYTVASWAAVKAAIAADEAAIDACTTAQAVIAYVITADLNDLETPLAAMIEVANTAIEDLPTVAEVEAMDATAIAALKVTIGVAADAGATPPVEATGIYKLIDDTVALGATAGNADTFDIDTTKLTAVVDAVAAWDKAVEAAAEVGAFETEFAGILALTAEGVAGLDLTWTDLALYEGDADADPVVLGFAAAYAALSEDAAEIVDDNYTAADFADIAELIEAVDTMLAGLYAADEAAAFENSFEDILELDDTAVAGLDLTTDAALIALYEGDADADPVVLGFAAAYAALSEDAAEIVDENYPASPTGFDNIAKLIEAVDAKLATL